MTKFERWIKRRLADCEITKLKQMVCNYYKKPMSVERDCENCPLWCKCHNKELVHDFFFDHTPTSED